MSLPLSTNKELMEGRRMNIGERNWKGRRRKRRRQKKRLCFYFRLAKVKFVEDSKMLSSTFVFTAELKPLEYVSYKQSY